MKTIITTLCILFTITACAQKTEGTKNTQTINWGGKAAAGSYAPEGTLAIKKSLATIKDSTITFLEVTIDMTTLSQDNERLTKHLRDKDFFHVKRYPEATFKLTKEFILDTDTVLQGTMTIKNKSQEEKIPTTATLSNGTLTITINHTMNRLDYGITYNSPSVFEKIKENAIADEITLRGSIKIQID